MTIKIGNEYEVRTVDTMLTNMNGERVVIVTIITEPDDDHDEDSLPMYVDRDGTEWWGDELVDNGEGSK